MNKELINLEPPSSVLKSRKQGNFSLTYLEGWYVIEKANEIFGNDGWSRRILSLTETSRDIVDAGKGKRHDVSYICQYEVCVGGQVAQDVGYGVGQSYNGVGEAVESAVKEAVTDSIKRCLRSFGNAFGNCLYDKQWLDDEKNGKHAEDKKPKQESNFPLPKDDGFKKEFLLILNNRYKTGPYRNDPKDFVGWIFGTNGYTGYKQAYDAFVLIEEGSNFWQDLTTEYLRHKMKAA